MKAAPPMTAQERQEAIVAELLCIEDPLERFRALVESPPPPAVALPERFRGEEHLVPGCVSRVWLGVWEDPPGRIMVAVDSESPALRAVGALYSRLYSGATLAEIAATEPDFLRRLGVDRQLTPTRRRGLETLRRTLLERTLAL